MASTGVPRTDPHASVLVVGASAAGIATAEALRRHGHVGRLTLLDGETEDPYDRPPLSKQYLAGQIGADALVLRSTEQLAGLDAEFVLGDRAVALDVATRTVTTTSGTTRAADHVVIATGVTPRAIPGVGLDGVHVLRTRADADRLRAGLQTLQGPLLVLGNGVLGSEVAQTAASLGVDVTLAGSIRAPMSGQLGGFGSQFLAAQHEAAGVRLLGGVRAARVRGRNGRADTVEFVDGPSRAADVVVVAVGSRPTTGWLEASGLEVTDGVGCDAFGAAAPGVWAVGDVARFHHVGAGRPMRLENRTNATEMAQVVAGNVLGRRVPYTPVPYFWTDQHGTRVQVFGQMTPADRVTVVDGHPEDGRFVAVAERAGEAVGALGWGMPKQARIASMRLHPRYVPGAASAASAAPALSAAPAAPAVSAVSAAESPAPVG